MLEFVRFEEIGRIHFGVDGYDVYMLLTTQEPVALPTLRNFLNGQYKTEPRHPGDEFCYGCQVVAKPYNDCQYVVILNNSYDC